MALSLYGGQPARDYDAIVRQFEGRRVNLAAPAKSLLLRKPLGELEHGGDVRLEDGGEHARVIQQWIAAGAPRGASPKLVRLEVEPSDAFVERVPATIDLSPVAVLAGGELGDNENLTRRDVRELAVYSAVDETATKITDSGRVTLLRRGRHVVLVRFMTEIVAVSVTAPLADAAVDLAKSPRVSFIDDEVLATLAQLRLAPSPQCDDPPFLHAAG
jgi:hypothetical protein